MKREIFSRLSAFAFAMGAILGGSHTLAQADFPSKPIRFVVPYPPGGSLDIISRALGAHLSKGLGQQVVVENRAGANGNIGLQAVASAPPDGYTVTIGSTASMSINPHLYKNPGFDARKDFAPIAMLGTLQCVLAVNRNVPANTFAEFVAYLKANPGRVNFASSGNGHTNHLTGEMFKQQLGVDIRHVPYKGDSPALTDLIADRAQMMFPSVLVATPYIRRGEIRAILAAGPERIPSFPDLPAAPEVGLDNLNADAWLGIFAPAGTPPAIAARLNREINAALSSQELGARMSALSVRLAPRSVEEFREVVARESAR
ncbi:MAG TPA: tripartite tricarboxylate transporter substrate binding protein, partial [Hyphomicrobiaceae bacterium]|nr:tripartite tricarboxylate transporter substrate binding protein [Hyphomicrobiaceae bacterium]